MRSHAEVDADALEQPLLSVERSARPVRPDGRGGPQLIPHPPAVQPGDPAPWAAASPDLRRPSLADLVAAVRGAPPPRPWPGSAPPGQRRESAVLVPLYEHEGEPFVVLTRRSWELRSHQGEVSFPGGVIEPGESARDAALREAHEEIALDPSTVDVVGELDHLATFSSRAMIMPFVGVLAGRPQLTPSPHEVDAVLHVPIAELLLPEIYREERWGWEDTLRPLSFFDLVGDTVWGATAAILRHLLTLVTATAKSTD